MFAICKTFPPGIPGLVTGLPDIPTACSPGCTVRRQQVCNYNSAACNSELFSTSCCHWNTACPGLCEHPQHLLSVVPGHSALHPFLSSLLFAGNSKVLTLAKQPGTVEKSLPYYWPAIICLDRFSVSDFFRRSGKDCFCSLFFFFPICRIISEHSSIYCLLS